MSSTLKAYRLVDHEEMGKCTIVLTQKEQAGEMMKVGAVSDGYHTFDELYFHRMNLFAVIANTYKNYAWKSKQHAQDDNDMYDGYFIVGITTPKGDYSYHYALEHWDNFNVKELERAPEWDGHTPDDITRLYSLIE